MKNTFDNSLMQESIRINYAGPHLTEEDADFVREAVLNGFYENYKHYTQILETKLCEITSSKFAIATNSCTAAIHLSLLSLGIREGDEVITTNSSCVASAMPIVYCGATPVFVDVDPSTWCLDPDLVRKAITSKTKAILAVHWNGHPSDLDSLMEIARSHNVYLIEDAAAALGAKVNDSHVGSIGDIGCFSFQGAKIAIGGQGGALVTNDPDLYEKARLYANYGRTDSQMPYWSDYVGFNYSMPSLPAALAVSQLNRLDELLRIKRKIFDRYRSGLHDSDEYRLIEPYAGTSSNFCYPPLLVSPKSGLDRDLLIQYLQAKNIDARNAQPRLNQMPMFRTGALCPNSLVVEKNGVILPSAFNLTDQQIDFVITELKTFATTKL